MKWVILWVMMALQTVFLVFTLGFLLFTRVRRWLARRDDERARAALAEPTRRVMLELAPVSELADALRALKPRTAARLAVALSGGRLSEDLREKLGESIRAEPWVQATLRDTASRWWWRRLEAARLLAVVADERDATTLERLLGDRDPAVVSAATAALARSADPRLIAAVLDQLHTRPPAVRAQQASALKPHWDAATPMLVRRLRDTRTPARLRVWVELLDSLDSSACVTELLALAAHESVELRIVVARVLGKCFHPDAVDALRRMLADRDWRVRAEAARSLGVLGVVSVVEDLSKATADRVWWVRFRSALALAGLGEQGRAALRRLRGSPDAYARDMAAFVSGLSEGSRIELSAG